MEQPSYFTKTAVPRETLKRCAEHNVIGKDKFTTKLLHRDENNEIFVHRSSYEYRQGVSTILTKADQCRFWAFTSYVMNFNILADEEKKKSKAPLFLGS